MRSWIHTRPYIVFAMTAFLMLTFGASFQLFLPLQFGLILMEVLVIGGVAFFFRKVDGGKDFPSLKHVDQPVSNLLLLVFTAVLIGLVANLVATLVVEVFPSLKPGEQDYAATIERLLRPEEWYLAISGVLAISVFAPLCEEFLFRGTLLPVQRRNEPRVMAIVMNGLLFGAIHFNPMSFVSLSIVGAFLAHVSTNSRSLWPAIIGHSALNLANGVVIPLIALDRAVPNYTPPLGELLVALAVIGPLAGSFWFLTTSRMRKAFVESGYSSSPS